MRLTPIIVLFISCKLIGQVDGSFFKSGHKNSSLTTALPDITTKSYFPHRTRKPYSSKSCHPFNVFCVPCKVTVNVMRGAMDKIVAFHKLVENVCQAIIGPHIICDSAIRITMFYLDHTPTLRVCKRFFFCPNRGIFDWWGKTDYPSNLSLQNVTVLETLNTPLNGNVLNSTKFQEFRQAIINFIDSYPDSDVSLETLPPGIENQFAEFAIQIEKASNIINRV